MRAVAVMPGKKNSAHVVNVDVPRIDDNKVLVKVFAVGLDGTDKEIDEGLYGEAPKGQNLLIIGHESLGQVIKTGKKVRGIKPSDMVVATVRRPDNCINCKAGENDMCLRGQYTERGIKGKQGYLAEYYVEHPDFLIKVPKSLGIIPVLLEPLSVAEKAIRVGYAVQKRMLWKPKTAMVTGTGTLGLLSAILLRLGGLDVVSVDRSDDHYKKKIFSRLGIKHFNTKKVNLHEILQRVHRQIDMIIEATGNSGVALHAMSVVGINGVVVLTSITGGDSRMDICSDCLNQGLVLGNKAVVGSVNANKRDFQQGVKDISAIQKRWPGLLSKLITAKYPPEKISDALASMKQNIKVVIEF
jgi:threonine dehydrogenase-like Zn-dependent dehydrogenase